MTTGDHKPMRRDAAERREALIRAAAECFARSGYLVPLEEIAERAGVGRGTLYRNFRDRMALALAVFEREIGRMEEGFDPALPLDRMIVELALRGAKTSALFQRLAVDMPLDETKIAEFKALGARLERLIQPAIDRARAAGELRADATPKQVMTAARMIVGLLLLPKYSQCEIEMVVSETLPIIMNGLRPR